MDTYDNSEQRIEPGQLTFSLLAPEFGDQYAAISGLFIAIAVGFAAFGNASSMSSWRRSVWSQPSPRDLIAHE